MKPNNFNTMVEAIISNKEDEYINSDDLFNNEISAHNKRVSQRRLFKYQDELAKQSEVFKRILQSEMSDDPDERQRLSDSPTSKTRNAMILRGVYNNKSDWEADILKNIIDK